MPQLRYETPGKPEPFNRKSLRARRCPSEACKKTLRGPEMMRRSPCEEPVGPGDATEEAHAKVLRGAQTCSKEAKGKTPSGPNHVTSESRREVHNVAQAWTKQERLIRPPHNKLGTPPDDPHDLTITTQARYVHRDGHKPHHNNPD